MSSIQNLAKRNQIIVYLITTFENASFSLPIWLLFYTRQLGLSVTGAISLGMTRWVVMAICNIPTGAWADRFGRVKLYRYGQFIYALTFVPFLFTKSIPILLIAQIIGGFAGSMTIGTLHPLVKDGHDLAKFPAKHYKNFLSTDNALLYTSRVLAGIFGAWLYSRYPKGPIILEIIILLGAFIASMLLHELRIKKPNSLSNRKHISDALNYIWHHSYLRAFFFIMILATIATESLWTALQPLFNYRNIQPEYFGLLFGLVAILSAVSSIISRKIPDSFNGNRLYAYYMSIALVGFGLMHIPYTWGTVIGLIPLGFAFGFFQPTKFANIQKHTSSSIQSTVLSASSLVSMMFYGFASVMVGRYVDLFSTGTMFKIITIQALLCTIIVYIIYFWSKNKT